MIILSEDDLEKTGWKDAQLKDKINTLEENIDNFEWNIILSQRQISSVAKATTTEADVRVNSVCFIYS